VRRPRGVTAPRVTPAPGLVWSLVRALPRKAVSRAFGFLAETPLPSPLLVPVLAAYARGFGADLSEAARPLSAYATFNDFFTRELRPGSRPLDPDPEALLSPVDGGVHACGPVAAGEVLQAKGVPYRVADLLGSDADAAPFEGGTYATLYLSPRDYHRIHWPFDATVDRVRHLPGDLWPVNDRALAAVPRLFARNERVAVLGRLASGAPVALVPVGALNVGSIRLAFHPLRTNRGAPAVPRTLRLDPAHAARRGDEAARFAFGSAVVLLLSPGAGRIDARAPRSTVRYGRRIGTLAP
jgi:phosphatidylserine decarboxylase